MASFEHWVKFGGRTIVVIYLLLSSSCGGALLSLDYVEQKATQLQRQEGEVKREAENVSKELTEKATKSALKQLEVLNTYK